MSEPKISVIIPAWNCEPFLARTIQCILTQSYPVHEIIVSDDASTDRTGEVARSFGGKVRYFRHEHMGCGNSRNYAIERAEGDWLALYDADDEWLPAKLERQVEVIRANPGLKWCSCLTEVVYPDHVVRRPLPPELKARVDRREPIHFFRHFFDIVICPASMMIHRSVFEELGLFDRELPLMEDRDMWWRIALRYPLIGYTGEVQCRYFKGVPGQMTDLKVRGRGRNVEATILLRHLRAARELGPRALADYRAMADILAYDYLFREAGGQAVIDPGLVRQLLAEFGLSARQRMTLKLIRMLPRRLAFRIVDRFRL